MAKHFIKDKDGHLMELSDEEYSSRKKRNGCLSIIGIGIIILIAALGGGDNDSKKSEDSQSSSSIKKETKVTNKSSSSHRERESASAIKGINIEENSIIEDEIEPNGSITSENNYENEASTIELEESFTDPSDEQ